MKRGIHVFSFRAQFATEQEAKKVELLAVKDTIVSANRTISILTYLGAAILLVWFVWWKILGNALDYTEFATYAVLFVGCLTARKTIQVINRDIEARYKQFQKLANIFSLFLILWADWITYLNTVESGSFSVMIFFTIIIIIPLSFFLKPTFFYTIQLIGALIVYAIILTCTVENQADNVANFTVCFVISAVSASSFFATRFKNYCQVLELEEASEKDSLTGLYNRLRLYEKSEEIWKMCKQQNEVVSCVFCDIDEFKVLSDIHGHRYGDECVQKIAEEIRFHLQEKTWYAFRYRSEEFLIILPKIGHAEACKWTEQLREAIDKQRKDKQFAMNFGIYTARPFEDSSRMEHYIVQANRLRYQAKQQGQNCICGRDETAEE